MSREYDLITVAIAQGASGTTELVAASTVNAYERILVVSYVMVADAAGTVKFQSGGIDKSGAMAFATNGGVAAVGPESAVLIAGERGGNLQIVSTVGAIKGHLTYRID